MSLIPDGAKNLWSRLPINMKRIRSVWALFTAAALLMAASAVALPVVEWDTVTGSGTSFFTSLRGGLGSSASLSCYPTWGIEYGIDYVELHANNGTVGISHQWFEVTYGELIDASTAANSDALARIITAQPVEFGSLRIFEGYPCYLGFQLGGYAASGYTAEFGWAELSYDGIDVSLVASATERTGLGIYAGTGTAIPEPATAGLLLAGAWGMAWRKRKP